MSTRLREELVSVDREGERIYGMLHLPVEADGPAPGVLLLHGFTGSSNSDNRILIRQARQLAASGIAALRFDFRGSGQSEGEFVEMTFARELADAVVMLDWLAAREEVDAGRLGVLGFSMGGAIAGGLVGMRTDVRALVLWAPVAHPLEVFAQAAGAAQAEASVAQGYADAGGEAIGHAFIAELFQFAPLDGVRGSSVPLRVIHGSADPTVPPREGQAYVDAVSGPRDLVAVEGANHTFTSIPWRTQLYQATTEWFEAHL